MASIEQLKSQMNKSAGIALTNQFAVQLPLLEGYDSRPMNLLCKSVTMPGKQITTKDKSIGLFSEKVVDGFLVDDVTMTFYVMNDYQTRLYFDAWRKLMVGEKRGEVGYKNDYAKTVTIHQLKKPDGKGLLGQEYSIDGTISETISNFGARGVFSAGIDFYANSIYSVELEDAFPTTMSAIELSNEPDGLVEMSVQFSYTNWSVKQDLLSKLNRGLKFEAGLSEVGLSEARRVITSI